MKIFAFGSSITSSYWNGAATYYRGIYRHLHALGHQIWFAEPDAYGRQQRRDAGDFSYVNSVVYHDAADIPALLRQASACDLLVKHSGVGVFDGLLEEKVLDCRSERTRVAFWDVDAPATLARVEADQADPFRALIPEYDFIFTYGGGPPVVSHYQRLGAANCHPIYNGHDPDTHHPVQADPASACDLLFVGHRLPDRERRVAEFFFRAAQLAPEFNFALGGEGWEGKHLPVNVKWLGHVGTGDHNRVNCSARMVLNINRDSMAGVGFSPPTRVFEAAGAGACLITDRWTGIEEFFMPGKEILVADNAEDVVAFLRNISTSQALEIGHKMRQRALRDHTYALRARQCDMIVADALASKTIASI
ncbi:MAG TPA: glycosyltransferase [Candidatus Angelobacter sp.]|nr:glycosyltransferase [Candidatus Angelobacter sp.]